jgi:hypothetical protein
MLVFLAPRMSAASLQRHYQQPEMTKKNSQLAPVNLEDEVVKQYEKFLAQVRLLNFNLTE